jgi:hypothetical protein
MDELNTPTAESAEADPGWDFVAAYDGAAAVLSVAVSMDEGERLSRRELCERTTVPYKTLYLSETIDELVAAGLLVKDESADEETEFGPNWDHPAVEAAESFETAFEDAA